MAQTAAQSAALRRRPMSLDEDAYPREDIEFESFNDHAIVVVPKRMYYSSESPGHWRAPNMHPDAHANANESLAFFLRIAFEFFGKMIQIGTVGTCQEVETAEYRKWAAKHGTSKNAGDGAVVDENGGITPPDSTHSDDDMQDDDASVSSRDKENRAPKRRKVEVPPPEKRFEKKPSLTFAKAGEIEETPKVRVFLTLLVKELHDAVIDLYSWKNIIAYAFVFVAIDPAYKFKEAAKAMTVEMTRRVQDHAAKLRMATKRPNYLQDVRDIVYRCRNEASIRGYDKVVSAKDYFDVVSYPYARFIGLGSVDSNEPFNTTPFGVAAYRRWCIANGVCAKQCGETPEDATSLRIFVPELTAELTMAQADPGKLVECQWPWFTEMERYVLAQPLTSYKVGHIGRHHDIQGDAPAADLVVLQSKGVVENRTQPIGAIKIPYPFDRAAVQYKKVVTNCTEVRRTYIRIANEMIAQTEAAITADQRERAQDEAINDTVERDTTLGSMAAYIKALAPYMLNRFTETDVNTVISILREQDKSYHQLQRTLEESYLSWMQPGNPDLPISVRGLLDWADARDYTFEDAAPIVTNELSIFGNYIYGVNVLVSAAFQVNGMISAFFAGFLVTLDAMDDHDGLRTHVYFYGDPAAGKSMILEILEKLLPFLTSNRESGGGSDKSAQYEDATNEVRFMHEAPPHLAGKRNSRDPRAHAKMTTHLDGMTSKAISWHVVNSTTDPTTGYTERATETATARFPGAFVVASNDYPQDAAVRSRHIMIEVRRPAVRASALLVKANACEVDAMAIQTRVVELFGAYYYINAHVRKAITLGWIPTPSTLLFDIQLIRAYDDMERLCVDGVADFRKHLQIRRLYSSAVMLDATTKAFFTPLSKRRALIEDPDGGLSLGPLRFEPWMVKDVVDYFVDNEEIAMMIGYVRFNELVSRFRHLVYRKMFSKLLSSGEFDETQLATWVRYVSYSDLVVHGPVATATAETPFVQSAAVPSFAIYGPTDLRSIYAYGSNLEDRGIGSMDPFVKMERVPDAVFAHFEGNGSGSGSGNTRPPTSPGHVPTVLETAMRALRESGASHASRQEVVGYGGATRTLPPAPATETFRHKGGEKLWTSMHASVYKMVPRLPGEYSGVCPKMDAFLQTPDPTTNNRIVDYDLNYIRLRSTSMASLAESLAREIKYDETADATGSERSVKDALDRLLRGNIRAYPLQKYRGPHDKQLSMEEFARHFLPQNLAPAMKDMRPIITVPRSDEKNAVEDIYVNVALLGITYELLRHRFLGVFSHKYTRERLISLGPTPNCVNDPMETFYLRKSDEVIVSPVPSFKGNPVEQEVLSRYIGRARVARDGVAFGSALARMVERVGSQDRTITFNGDMEEICASDYKKEHNIPSGTMPADCDRLLREMYEGRRDENSQRYFTFSYTAAVAEELERERARHGRRYNVTGRTAGGAAPSAPAGPAYP